MVALLRYLYDLQRFDYEDTIWIIFNVYATYISAILGLYALGTFCMLVTAERVSYQSLTRCDWVWHLALSLRTLTLIYYWLKYHIPYRYTLSFLTTAVCSRPTVILSPCKTLLPRYQVWQNGNYSFWEELAKKAADKKAIWDTTDENVVCEDIFRDLWQELMVMIWLKYSRCHLL